MDAQAEAERRPDDIRIINVKGQLLRVAIRPGKGTGTPLLLMNGIGVSFEVFQPFRVARLDSFSGFILATA